MPTSAKIIEPPDTAVFIVSRQFPFFPLRTESYHSRTGRGTTVCRRIVEVCWSQGPDAVDPDSSRLSRNGKRAPARMACLLLGLICLHASLEELRDLNPRCDWLRPWSQSARPETPLNWTKNRQFCVSREFLNALKISRLTGKKLMATFCQVELSNFRVMTSPAPIQLNLADQLSVHRVRRQYELKSK